VLTIVRTLEYSAEPRYRRRHELEEGSVTQLRGRNWSGVVPPRTLVGSESAYGFVQHPRARWPFVARVAPNVDESANHDWHPDLDQVRFQARTSQWYK